MQLSPLARSLAGLTAGVALISLGLRFAVQLRGVDGLLAGLWFTVRYFTILTNAMVVVTFADMAFRGRRAHDSWLAALVLWIGAVGLVYHALLATLWEPRGINYLADIGLHTAVPLLVFGWWLAFAGRDRLTWVDPLLWMGWPVLYLGYTLVRSAMDGIYPYPFLDPARVPPQQLVWNVARLMEGFLAGGYLLFAGTQVFRRG